MSVSFPTVVFLFSLWLPVWEQRPLAEADLRPGPYPLMLPAGGAAAVRAGFASGDAEWRGRLAVQLGRTQDPQAFELLAAQLPREDQPVQQATLLQQLANATPLPAGLAAVLPRYGTSADPAVRAAALALLPAPAALPPPEALLAATRDADPGVRAAAWGRLRSLAGVVPPPFLAKALAGADPACRAAAAACALNSPGAAALAPALNALAKDADPRVRTALAGGLAAAPAGLAAQLFPVLAADSHPTVRAKTAEALAATPATAALEAVAVRLTGDPAAEVRRAATGTLAHFASPASRDAALARLGDTASLVRQAAEDTLVTLNQARVPAVPAIIPFLNDAKPACRARAVRVLGRIGWPRPGGAPGDAAVLNALKARVAKEKDPEALAAVIFCLGRVEARQAAPAIARLARHPVPEVRLEIATTLAALKDPATYPALDKLVFDEAAPVRAAALLGIGRNGDPALAPILTRVLEAVAAAADSKITAVDRASAAWAAGHLRQADPALVKRLLAQASTPVVPTMMGMVFDADVVLANAAWALARTALRNPAVKPQVQPVLKFLQTRPDSQGTMTAMSFLPSAEVAEAARQAAASLDRRPVTVRPRPTQDLPLPCRPAREVVP